MTDFKITERLYLSREDDIFVDHSQLPQHQIDGVRFLYAQFKKKKPGVILNDPLGYGKTLQVVLFLSAVKRLLPAPVLVLVKDGELALWREHFQRWTQLKDDVVFESSNPYVKKAVFVSTRQHAAALARRDWAVAVDDAGTLRDRPQADFKIWMTHADMREDLYTFSSIYQWLYPKETFNVRDFEVNKTDPKDVVAKSLLLDAFFEDKVLRRKNFTPFKKPETYTSLTIEPPKISRKNKDATGTKIKRSKARIEAENHATKIPRLDPPERNATITSKDYYKERGLDIESFIQNEKPVQSDGIEDFVDFQTLMSKSDSTDRTVHDIVTARRENENATCNGVKINATAKDDMSESVSEVNTADFQDAIDDIVRNENDDDSCVTNENEREEGIDMGNNKNEAATGNDVDISNSKDLEVSVLEETNVETIQDVVNNGSKKDLDSKLSDLEEKTLNKFKGSLLDSIF